MSHFRKMLLASAALVASFVGSAGTASAQSNPFVCSTTFTPLTVRLEGLREIVGDIVIRCEGGNGVTLSNALPTVYLQPNAVTPNVPTVTSSPTATTYAAGTGTTGDLPGCWLNLVLQTGVTTSGACAGVAGASWSTGSGAFTPLTVPAINISVTIPGTRITNRVFSSTTGLTDALLFIDEPRTPSAGSTTANQNPCTGTAGVCTGLQYFYNASGDAVGAGSPGSNFRVTSPINVFQGQLGQGGNVIVDPSTITFVGVPIVQPGVGNGTRTYRIKNIRVQVANQFTSGQFSAQISVQNPPANLVLNNATGVVGVVQQGLVFSAVSGGPYAQCLGFNAPGGAYAAESTSSTRNNLISSGFVRFTEGYGVSFKRRGFGSTLDVFESVFNPGYLSGFGQSDPTVNYNNESGFYNTAFPTTNSLNLAGIASNGTRLRVRFSNIPTLVRLYVSAQPVTTTGSCSSSSGGIQTTTSTTSRLICPGSSTGTLARNAAFALTNTASSDGAVEGFTANTNYVFGLTGSNGAVQGSGADGWGGGGAAYGSLEKSQVLFVRVPVASDGTGVFFWEVLRAEDNVIDRFDFLVAASFPPTTSIVTDANASVTARVSGSYAPVAATGGNGYPSIPSFAIPNPAESDIFVIGNCATNLLYPFVSSVTGFNTGIAVANTSSDPFGTVNETGICRVYYYGTLASGGANPNAATFTKSVPSGQVATFNLLFGGPEYGIQPVVGFQGYIIISCNFRWAHGFAFISDPSNLQTAQGYLALILDPPGLRRSTNAESEALDN